MTSSNEGGENNKKVVPFPKRGADRGVSPTRPPVPNQESEVTPLDAIPIRSAPPTLADANQRLANATKAGRQRELENAPKVYRFSAFMTQRPAIFGEFQQVFLLPSRNLLILQEASVPDFTHEYPSIKTNHLRELSDFLLSNMDDAPIYTEELEKWLRAHFPKYKSIGLIFDTDENTVSIVW